MTLTIASAAMLVAAPTTNYLDRALAAWKAGEQTNALALVDLAVAAEPKATRPLNFRAQIRSLMGLRAEGIADVSSALALEPKSAWLYHERAEHRFRAGDFAGSCEDFAKSDALSPQRAAHNWQYGIALYYAGRFVDGKKLFELHQTVNPQDVENAAWHFLCVARIEGVEKARAVLIPIAGDTRIPMRQVQALFAGTGTEADVFKAADAGDADVQTGQKFYAHLYVGLYHEAAGRNEAAALEIRQAAVLARYGGYMGEVARVHAAKLDQEAAVKGK